jgi:hypothetical protein
MLHAGLSEDAVLANGWLQEAIGAETKSGRIPEEHVRLNSENEAWSEAKAAVRAVEISVSRETPRALKPPTL